MSLVGRTTALIAVDLMSRIVEQDLGPHRGEDVVARTVELASAVRSAGGVVVLVRTERPGIREQPPGSGLVPQLRPQDRDILVVKRTIGAFYGTDLASRLREHAIETVIMAGLATTMGVESTARAAADHGFDVLFAADAMSGMTADEHEHALTVVLPRFGQVLGTEQLLAQLRAAD